MYPYHSVLDKFGSLVKFYVVDAIRLPSGRAQVRLTVLMDAETTYETIDYCYELLWDCIGQSQLRDLCIDIGVDADIDRPISFCVTVRHFRTVQP